MRKEGDCMSNAAGGTSGNWVETSPEGNGLNEKTTI